MASVSVTSARESSDRLVELRLFSNRLSHTACRSNCDIVATPLSWDEIR
jgi:hypothetical protein